MATLHELERIAAMAVALRPEWVLASVLTNLKANHGTKPYRDLAVAIAWIATDPDTLTPGRLLEAGPWWAATTPRDSTDARSHGNPYCNQCGHAHPLNAPHDIHRKAIDRDNPERRNHIEAARQAALAAAHGTTDEQEPA